MAKRKAPRPFKATAGGERIVDGKVRRGRIVRTRADVRKAAGRKAAATRKANKEKEKEGQRKFPVPPDEVDAALRERCVDEAGRLHRRRYKAACWEWYRIMQEEKRAAAAIRREERDALDTEAVVRLASVEVGIEERLGGAIHAYESEQKLARRHGSRVQTWQSKKKGSGFHYGAEYVYDEEQDTFTLQGNTHRIRVK